MKRYLLSSVLFLVLVQSVTWIIAMERESGSSKKGSIKEKKQLLIDAAKVGDKEYVKKLLQEGIPVNCLGVVDELRLLLVQQKSENQEENSVDTVQIKKYNNLNKVTALSAAAAKGHKEIVEMLLKAGATVNAQDSYGQTALSNAVRYPEVVKLLLEARAKVDIQDKDGFTALKYAIQCKAVDTVEMLLKAGAGVDIEDSFRITPLKHAWSELCQAFKEQWMLDVDKMHELTLLKKIVLMLLNYTKVPVKELNRMLLIAIMDSKVNDEEILTTVLQKGADPQLKISGCPVLLLATDAQLERTVYALLKQGADPNARDQVNQVTPLIRASELGNSTIAEALLDFNADVNQASREGVTPLMLASYKGNQKIVARIIALKPDINARSAHKGTALCSALLGGHKAIIKDLLKAGSSLKFIDQSQESRAQLLEYIKDDEEIQELVLFKAVQEGYNELVKDLELPNKYKRKDKNNNTLLQLAARFGHKELVALFLAEGLDVNAQNNSGYTALLCALSYRHKEIIPLLLTHGALLSACTNEGKSGFIIALKEGCLSYLCQCEVTLPYRPLLTYFKNLSSAVNKQACNVCNKGDINLLSCSNCRMVRYCSQECQRKAWPEHKIVCRKIALADKLITGKIDLAHYKEQVLSIGCTTQEKELLSLL